MRKTPSLRPGDEDLADEVGIGIGEGGDELELVVALAEDGLAEELAGGGGYRRPRAGRAEEERGGGRKGEAGRKGPRRAGGAARFPKVQFAFTCKFKRLGRPR